MMNQVWKAMQPQDKWHAAYASAKRTTMFAATAGLGGIITFASILLPRTPDAIGLFFGASTAVIGVGGGIANGIRTIRCLKKRQPDLTVE